MGGLLFHLPRMPRAAYLAVEADVRRYLDGLLPGQYRIPRYYDDKPDFGDLDVLVESRPDWDELRERIVRDLGIAETKATGHVFSTVYRGLQTDFFTVAARHLDSMYNFMSFNDLGNFIGRICRRFDLKYGEQGLAYVYRRAGGHYKVDLEITQDFERICAFLGLDHARWRAGFQSLPDIFEWVMESPYFSVAPYLDETDGDLEPRKQERPTVARFVEYLRARGASQRPAFEERAAWLPMVIAAFPEADLARRIDAERAAGDRQSRFAVKFNGKRVMALVPGVGGEALGALIVAIKRSVPDFESYVLETPQEEIDQHILAVAAATSSSTSLPTSLPTSSSGPPSTPPSSGGGSGRRTR